MSLLSNKQLQCDAESHPLFILLNLSHISQYQPWKNTHASKTLYHCWVLCNIHKCYTEGSDQCYHPYKIVTCPILQWNCDKIEKVLHGMQR